MARFTHYLEITIDQDVELTLSNLEFNWRNSGSTATSIQRIAAGVFRVAITVPAQDDDVSVKIKHTPAGDVLPQVRTTRVYQEPPPVYFGTRGLYINLGTYVSLTQDV